MCREQAEIDVSKDRLTPFCVGIPQRAPLWYTAHSQMRPRVKRLPVTFSARFRADLEDFVPVKILAELREDRLSGKKCTFDHSVLFLFVLW